MGKQIYLNKTGNNSGFTLLEVLISILILSIIITSATAVFSYSIRVSRENKLGMTAIDLANEAVENIRSLEFAEVGTKIIVGGTTIYGDPNGEILQTRTETVDDVEYTIDTTISWEEQGGWDLGATDWDYKSVRVSVVPTQYKGNAALTKVIETYVTRDSTQPALTGSNISLRVIRGWNTVPGSIIPVINAKVSLISGPSAPRQVQSSSAGVARFINLASGNYKVKVDPGNLGMMLLPGEEADWAMSLSGSVTVPKEFHAEFPCSIRILLKDLDGNPITLKPSVTGSIKMLVPYGTEINKNFSLADIDASGFLPQNFITGLWPVGDGYTGAYTISAVSIDQCQYLGSYETGALGEVPWSGKFNGPGTSKDITCYFGTIPATPSGINTSWLGIGQIINTGSGPYISYDKDKLNIIAGKFDSGNPTQSISMPGNTTVDYNASAIYFENIGNATANGLLINGKSNLILHTSLVVFRGTVELKESGTPAVSGKITLRTFYSDGTSAGYIDGSKIGGKPGVSYGKLYLAKPLLYHGADLLEPGGYYFYDSLVLPDNASQLIPITKENYIH